MSAYIIKEPMDIFDYLRKKYPNSDFFKLYEQRDRIAKKLPMVENVSNNRYKHHKINPLILKEKLLVLFDVLIKKRYKNIEMIEKCKNIIEKEDLRYYSQNQQYRFCYTDNFNNVYDFYYSDLIKKIQKYKRWTIDREFNIYCLLDAIIVKNESKIRESKYYSSIRKFKHAKKQTFLISFDFDGTYYFLDWYQNHKEKVYIFISDTSKEAALERLQKDNKATHLVIDMLSSRDCQGNIKNIQFLPFTDENITLAKRLSNKKYDKWNCHSDEINFLRR